MINKTYKKQNNNKLKTRKRYSKTKTNGVNTNKIIKKNKRKSKIINLKGGAKNPKHPNHSEPLDKILDDIFISLSNPFTHTIIEKFQRIIKKLEVYKKDNIIYLLIENINNLSINLKDCEYANQKSKIDECKNFAKNVKELKQKLKLIVLLKQIHDTINQIDTENKTKIDYFTSLIAKLVSITEDEKYDVFIQNLNNFNSSISEYKKDSNTNLNTGLRNSINDLKLNINKNIDDYITDFTTDFTILENVKPIRKLPPDPVLSAKPLNRPASYATIPASSAKEAPSSATGHASSATRPARSATGHASSATRPASSGKGPASSATGHASSATGHAKLIVLIPPKVIDFNPKSNSKHTISYNNISDLNNETKKLLQESDLEIEKEKKKAFNITGIKLIQNSQTKYTTLSNIRGSSCYLNSTIQFLFAIPEIREIIKANPNNSNQTNALKLFLDYYEKNPGKILDIDDAEEENKEQTIYNQLYTLTKYAQMDVTEFFLLKIFPFIETNPIFIDNFSLIPREEITCIDDTKQEKNFLREGEYEKTLQIEINYETDVIQDLQYYIQRKYDNEIYDIKEKAIVEICKSESNPEGKAKSHKINSFNTNKYIILYIKRFKYIDDKTSIKVRTSINPNPLIYIDPDQKIYKLKSCIIHIGTTIAGGHYIYLNFDDAGNPLHVIDDSRVYDYDGQTNESRNYIINGYVYLYEQIEIT